MKQHRVVILKSRFLRPGGQEAYARHIAHGFLRRGCEVIVLTTDTRGSSPPPFEIVNVCDTGSSTILNTFQFDGACRRWLKQNRADVVFGMDRNYFQTHIRAGNGVHRSYLKRRAAAESWLKTLSTAINPQHHLLLLYERLAFKHPGLQRIFANSEMVRQELIEGFSLDPKKVVTVHNGVDWEGVGSAFAGWHGRRELICESLSLNPAWHQFLFVGSGFARKGLALLLEALARLSDATQWELSVVGNDKDIEKYHALVTRLRLSRRVHFFGEQKEVVRFYQVADTLLIPSLYDPFANVTLEALACGVPVVSSRSNGAHEILIPGTSGWIVDTITDRSAFAQVLEQALKQSKTIERSSLIRNSVAHLSFSTQIDKLIDITLQG